MTIYMLLLCGIALVVGGWYRRCGEALGADTTAHDHHEADAGTDNAKRGNS